MTVYVGHPPGWLTVFFVTLVMVTPLGAFYVPGVAPVEFASGQPVSVQAIKMTSTQTLLPFEYYHLPFCKPDDDQLNYKSENLGEVLRGDRIVNTPYVLKMKQNVACRPVCQSQDTPLQWSAHQTNLVIERIEQLYSVHLLVDNLPCATWLAESSTGSPQLHLGHRLGGVTGVGNVYINNHLKLTVLYHTVGSDKYRVVGFRVQPSSLALEAVTGSATVCQIEDKNKVMFLEKDKTTAILFTYSVEWVESEVRWASRWDPYLYMSDVQIHWLSIVNSIVAVLLLSAVIAMIIIRTLRRDIARYNQLTGDADDEAGLDETGWKLVHGDVFRPPTHNTLLAALTGSGVQIYFMAAVTIFFAMLGMLSPASRGSLMTAAITLYNFMGLAAGHVSARLYKTLRGRQWKRTALWTAVLYPGTVSSVVLFINFFILSQGSSRAIPFTSMLSLLAMWFGISVPLVFIGSYYGFSRPPFQHPVRTNQIPRQVPDQPWYNSTFICSLLAGVLPFGVVFYDAFLIFSAIWENQFYYMFGFLFLVFVIVSISCCQITIAFVYFQLCREDYRWWWRSYLISAGSTMYLAAYCVFYFVTKLEIEGFVPTLLYFGYSFLMLVTYWLSTGTVGFLATYLFVTRIYSAVKID